MSSQSTLDAINLWSYLCGLRLKGKLKWDDGQIVRTVLNAARNQGLFVVKDSNNFPEGILLLDLKGAPEVAHVIFCAASTKSALDRLLQWGLRRFPGISITAKRHGKDRSFSSTQTKRLITKLLSYGHS